MSTFDRRKHIPILVQDALSELGHGMALKRKTLRLTQSDLALQAGVGLSTVVSLEKGHDGVSLGNLCKVLDVLGTLDQLACLVQTNEESP